MGCDGFHARVPLDLKEMRGEVVTFFEKVEECGTWPLHACTSKIFLIPKNVTRERSFALLLALNGWWKGLREPEVTRWQERHRVEWDAIDGRNGGAERTGGEMLLCDGKELITEHVKRTRERKRWCLVWPRGLSVSVSQLCGSWATHFNFLVRILWGYVVTTSTSSGFSLKGALRDRSRPPRPSSLEMELFSPSHCASDPL